MYYDADLLVETDCRSNIAYCGSFPGQGRTRLAGAIAQGASGRVAFAEITYREQSFRGGVAQISFTINQLATPTSQELAASTENATITIVWVSPGPTPGPGVKLQGDTDCDGDADSADALGVLRDAAGFPGPKCAAAGDVDCDGDRDPADALAILRYAAGLPPSPQSEPCPDIGTPA